MSEYVFAIPSHLVGNLYSKRGLYKCDHVLRDIMLTLERYGRFLDRSFLEATPTWKQIVSVGLIQNSNGYLCLRRSKKSNRGSLRLKWSLFVGGHVDEADLENENPVSNCIKREIREELGLYKYHEPRFMGIIADPANDVGRLHLAFIFHIFCEDAFVDMNPRLDNSEFVNAKKRHKVEFKNVTDIMLLKGKLDPWSSIFVEEELSKYSTSCQITETNCAFQYELPFVCQRGALSE